MRALALLALGALLSFLAGRWLRSIRVRARLAHARRGELHARGLLTAHGFEVLAEQAPGSVVLEVDGSESAFAIRADYLVRRGRRTFVAEVKTGARAPSLDHGPTRRQLLEYASAFAVDGVLLVDADAGTLREVRFLRSASRGARPFVSGLALGLAIGGAALAIALTSP